MTDGRRSMTMASGTRGARGRRRRRGFTLTELLVVIAVIVLMLAMAVPLFNVFSGSRSIEGGQNLVSAMLQRARARAIAMQERRGVFFFEDQATRKTGMLLVRIDEPAPPSFPPPAGYVPGTYVLELDDQDEEVQFLPTGVGAAFILGRDPRNASATGGPISSTTYRPYGLIAFDGVGRIVTLGNYTTQTTDANRYPPDTNVTPNKPGGMTNLMFHYDKNIYSTDALGKSQFIGTSASQETSHTAVLLYDKNVLGELQGSGDARDFSAQQSQWLDQNGTALVVNRYNGTIFRGE